MTKPAFRPRDSRSWLNRALLSLASISLAGVCFLIWQALDRPIEKFRILGELTAREQIKVTDTLRELRLPGLLSADLLNVQKQLDTLGWARDISVRRVWPNTLEVVLLKEGPVAHWGSREFVSASGTLLSLPDSYPRLPKFDVAVSSPREAMKVYRLVSHLAVESELAIVGLNQDEQGGWRVIFDNDLEVFLGTDRLSERMQRFNRVYQSLAQKGRTLSYMDLRYNNGVAVKYVDHEEGGLLVAGQLPRSHMGAQ